MPRMLINLLGGTLFGLGLSVSGMVNPAKIIGFLDFAGTWDPTLAFVFGGALLIAIPAFRLIFKRQHPVLADEFELCRPRKRWTGVCSQAPRFLVSAGGCRGFVRARW